MIALGLGAALGAVLVTVLAAVLGGFAAAGWVGLAVLAAAVLATGAVVSSLSVLASGVFATGLRGRGARFGWVGRSLVAATTFTRRVWAWSLSRWSVFSLVAAIRCSKIDNVALGVRRRRCAGTAAAKCKCAVLPVVAEGLP